MQPADKNKNRSIKQKCSSIGIRRRLLVTWESHAYHRGVGLCCGEKNEVLCIKTTAHPSDSLSSNIITDCLFPCLEHMHDSISDLDKSVKTSCSIKNSPSFSSSIKKSKRKESCCQGHTICIQQENCNKASNRY